MNRTVKKLLTALLALAMLAALCACGGKIPKDPVKAMAAAEEKLGKADSVSYDMELQMTLDTQGENIDLSVIMQAETTKSPLAAHSNVRMEMFGLDTENYLIEQDGSYLIYTAVKGEEATEWYKMALTQEELQAQLDSYDADNFFSTQLDVAQDLALTGEDTVNGRPAMRYDGMIPAAAIGESLAAAGGEAGDTLELLGIDPAQLKDPVPIAIWLYADGLPARYEFDLTDVLSQLLSQSETTADISFSAMHVAVTITGVNNVKSITLPEEAKDAQDVNDIEHVEDEESLETAWEEAELGETFTLSDGTELTVSTIKVDADNHVILMDAGLSGPDNAPLAALLCTDGQEEYQLEEYTVDETGRYVFDAGELQDPQVYAAVFVDGDPEDGVLWWVNTILPSES